MLKCKRNKKTNDVVRVISVSKTKIRRYVCIDKYFQTTQKHHSGNLGQHFGNFIKLKKQSYTGVQFDNYI